MQLPENFGTILRKIPTFHLTLKIFSPFYYGVKFDFVWKVTVKLQYFDKYAGWGPLTSAIKPSNIMPHWYIMSWPLRKGQKTMQNFNNITAIFLQHQHASLISRVGLWEKGKKRERDISTQASCPSRIDAPSSLEPKKHLHPQQLNALGLHP